ncbi:MAG: hypothetical protein HFG29_10180 [Eubacterium sp.]|nr:hypothetical protein [Eubacterium sp.]
MKFIYHINGEERYPTKKEWAQMTERAFEMAGYVRVDDEEEKKEMEEEEHGGTEQNG